MVNEKINELVKKYKVLEQKKAAATVDLDGEILKYEAKLQKLREEKSKATEKFSKKQKEIEAEVKAFMVSECDEKTYDAGIGKVSLRITESVFCADEKAAAAMLEGSEFVRTKIELDKNKIKAEMNESTMRKHGIEIKKNYNISIK